MSGSSEIPRLVVRRDDGSLSTDVGDVLAAFRPDPDEVDGYEDAMERQREAREDR